MPKKKLFAYPYDKDNFDPPAPVLEVSLSTPTLMSHSHIVKSLALLDSGADMTVIPQWIVQQLQLKYVDKIPVAGYKGRSQPTFVYSVKIIFSNLGDFIIRAIASDSENVLIGRDILNKWLLFLKGRSGIFEIS